MTSGHLFLWWNPDIHVTVCSAPVGGAVRGDIRGCDLCTCSQVFHLHFLQPLHSCKRSPVWMEPEQQDLQLCAGGSGGRSGGHVSAKTVTIRVKTHLHGFDSFPLDWSSYQGALSLSLSVLSPSLSPDIRTCVRWALSPEELHWLCDITITLTFHRLTWFSLHRAQDVEHGNVSVQCQGQNEPEDIKGNLSHAEKSTDWWQDVLHVHPLSASVIRLLSFKIIYQSGSGRQTLYFWRRHQISPFNLILGSKLGLEQLLVILLWAHTAPGPE